MSRLAPYAKEHSNLNGAGDSRPSALQIIKDQGLGGKLGGKVFFVTGCSSGIGVETARALHATGADVYISARDAEKAQKVIQDIISDGGSGKVEFISMELDSFESVRAGAKVFLGKSRILNVLINNAGVMACPESTTQDGHETQFGTNHLGHFLLFQLLKPTLLASSTPEFNSRVVSVSSTGHRAGKIYFEDHSLKTTEGGYSPWKAYGQAKLANILFANELDRRYGGKGLHALSLHPGGIWTPLQRHLGDEFKNASDTPQVRAYMKSTEQGAATTVWAAVAKEWEGRGGRYLEDCEEAALQAESDKGNPLSKGHAPQAYDPETEKKLWEVSCEIVGVKDD